jgi:osmotically-inducible protein OsmY
MAVDKVEGAAAEAASRAIPEQVDPEVLAARVRAEMGHHVSHARKIEVAVKNGLVTLSGMALASEVQPLLAAIKNVRGVRDVDNQLQVYDSEAELQAVNGS